MLEWLDDPQRLRRAIAQLIAEGQRTDIAVAFWGSNALARLGASDPSMAQRLRIIANLGSGATNSFALRDVWSAVGPSHVQQLDDLHAKVFVSDHCLIVGSANVSANGLGAEGVESDGWREACLRTDDRGMIEAAQRWFAAQWVVARPIAAGDFEIAMEAWNRTRRRRTIAHPAPGTKGGLMALTADMAEGRRIFVAISSKYMSAPASRIVEQAHQEDPTVDGYEDWPSMPLGATLLAFDVDSSSKGDTFRVTWDGAWDTPADKERRRRQTRKRVTLIHQARPEDALGITDANCGPWERDIQLLCTRFKASRTGLPVGHTWDDWCLSLEDAGWLLQNPEADERLDTVTDETLRSHIASLAAEGASFRTTDLIRAVVGRYYRDRLRKGRHAPNVRFAQRLSDSCERLGIQEIHANEDVQDDARGWSMTSRWERVA